MPTAVPFKIHVSYSPVDPTKRKLESARLLNQLESVNWEVDFPYYRLSANYRQHAVVKMVIFRGVNPYRGLILLALIFFVYIAPHSSHRNQVVLPRRRLHTLLTPRTLVRSVSTLHVVAKNTGHP